MVIRRRLFGGRLGVSSSVAGKKGSGLLGRLLVGNRDGSFFAGRAVVDFDEILVEPKFDFVVAFLIFGWHFKNLDVDFAAAVKVADDGIGKFRKGARANIAFGVVAVFVHEEKDVGLVEMLVIILVALGEAIGISIVARGENTTKRKTGSGRNFGREIFVFEDRTRPVDDLIAAAFEVATPVECAFVEFGAARDNKFFHN